MWNVILAFIVTVVWMIGIIGSLKDKKPFKEIVFLIFICVVHAVICLIWPWLGITPIFVILCVFSIWEFCIWAYHKIRLMRQPIIIPPPVPNSCIDHQVNNNHREELPSLLSSFHDNGSPAFLYHGTPRIENAISILKDNYWIIGQSTPPGIWLTRSFAYAKNVAGQDGAILMIMVGMNTPLTECAITNYRLEIPNADRSKKYRIPGLRPIRAYNANGKRIDLNFN